MSDKHHIPQYLDEPFKLILWTVDELIALLVPFLILMLCFNSPITGLLLGAILLIVLKKLKGEQGHYFIHHLIYWYLPAVIRFKKTPPSYSREWLG